MRMRLEDIHAMDHAGQHDVVDIASRPGEETLVLDAPHCLPNSELRHSANLMWISGERYGGLARRAIAATPRLDSIGRIFCGEPLHTSPETALAPGERVGQEQRYVRKSRDRQGEQHHDD